jgi:hypothetical protein
LTANYRFHAVAILLFDIPQKHFKDLTSFQDSKLSVANVFTTLHIHTSAMVLLLIVKGKRVQHLGGL